MKRFAFVLGVFSILTASASAQTLPDTFSVEQNGVSLAGSNQEVVEDVPEKTKAYDKRVGGKVWLEATAGPSRFNATQFRTLDFIPAGVQALIPRVVVNGPEFGAALRFRAGSTTIGARYKRADYAPFDLTTIGLDLGFLIRAVPYVHPSIRLGFNYYTTTGGLVLPGFESLVSNVRSNGGGASIGLGLRIPLVKWVSIAAGFDYSIIGLVFQGNENVTGGKFTAGTAGTAIAGTFALTIHLGT
ncbi:MAG: hypothetical protein JRG67_07330 [Deltaproteobacteria bacterium]|nr:hypothetical protein [Deltaproteobacteria bacterium]MBW1874754.1 hypothetical protein [Deltaproteobacteria bacterium]MBW2210846.1 hypothetical protein [Deltaproteobacteria bacterium]MBW2213779.1 hypothetical protein [Deltaproteobacteria bacterium]MBW2379007.1 hypothetical protein [Deltaproteobacteria bacterium]